ncbi:MAG: sigma-70 family RNA polymerase sigma factor [Desulfobacteraceae bacterium]|jgi:RNA polymerase sigma-70 factor (ECF subfamily)
MNEETKKPVGEPKEDALLIRDFCEGDKAAFDNLVLKHKDRLFSLCYRLLGDYEEANDSAQETFIKVYRSLKKFRLESAFSTWLYRIAVNTCKNKLKSSAFRQKRKMVPLENPISANRSSPSREIQDDSQCPAMALENKERMRVIQEAINALPEEQREVVTLRDIEGFSYEEVAEITGFNLGTVKSRLARARLSLRKTLRSVI